MNSLSTYKNNIIFFKNWRNLYVSPFFTRLYMLCDKIKSSSLTYRHKVIELINYKTFNILTTKKVYYILHQILNNRIFRKRSLLRTRKYYERNYD